MGRDKKHTRSKKHKKKGRNKKLDPQEESSPAIATAHDGKSAKRKRKHKHRHKGKHSNSKRGMSDNDSAFTDHSSRSGSSRPGSSRPGSSCSGHSNSSKNSKSRPKRKALKKGISTYEALAAAATSKPDHLIDEDLLFGLNPKPFDNARALPQVEVPKSLLSPTSARTKRASAIFSFFSGRLGQTDDAEAGSISKRSSKRGSVAQFLRKKMGRGSIVDFLGFEQGNSNSTNNSGRSIASNNRRASFMPMGLLRRGTMMFNKLLTGADYEADDVVKETDDNDDSDEMDESKQEQVERKRVLQNRMETNMGNRRLAIFVPVDQVGKVVKNANDSSHAKIVGEQLVGLLADKELRTLSLAHIHYTSLLWLFQKRRMKSQPRTSYLTAKFIGEKMPAMLEHEFRYEHFTIGQLKLHIALLCILVLLAAGTLSLMEAPAEADAAADFFMGAHRSQAYAAQAQEAWHDVFNVSDVSETGEWRRSYKGEGDDARVATVWPAFRWWESVPELTEEELALLELAAQPKVELEPEIVIGDNPWDKLPEDEVKQEAEVIVLPPPRPTTRETFALGLMPPAVHADVEELFALASPHRRALHVPTEDPARSPQWDLPGSVLQLILSFATLGGRPPATAGGKLILALILPLGCAHTYFTLWLVAAALRRQCLRPAASALRTCSCCGKCRPGPGASRLSSGGTRVAVAAAAVCAVQTALLGAALLVGIDGDVFWVDGFSFAAAAWTSAGFGLGLNASQLAGDLPRSAWVAMFSAALLGVLVLSLAWVQEAMAIYMSMRKPKRDPSAKSWRPVSPRPPSPTLSLNNVQVMQVHPADDRTPRPETAQSHEPHPYIHFPRPETAQTQVSGYIS